MTPGQYDALPQREKLAIIGFIEVYMDAQKEAQKEALEQARSAGKGR